MKESVDGYWAEIPPIVREFVPRYIKSATALEILLIIQSTPQEEWRLLEISGALELDPAIVAARIEELTSAGLVSDRRPALDCLYRFPQPMKSSWRLTDWQKRTRCIPSRHTD